MTIQELTMVIDRLTPVERRKLGEYAKRLIAMRKIPKMKTYTTEDFLKFAEVTDKEASEGKTVSSSIVLADLRGKRSVQN